MEIHELTKDDIASMISTNRAALLADVVERIMRGVVAQGQPSIYQAAEAFKELIDSIAAQPSGVNAYKLVSDTIWLMRERVIDGRTEDPCDENFVWAAEAGAGYFLECMAHDNFAQSRRYKRLELFQQRFDGCRERQKRGAQAHQDRFDAQTRTAEGSLEYVADGGDYQVFTDALTGTRQFVGRVSKRAGFNVAVWDARVNGVTLTGPFHGGWGTRRAAAKALLKA